MQDDIPKDFLKSGTLLKIKENTSITCSDAPICKSSQDHLLNWYTINQNEVICLLNLYEYKIDKKTVPAFCTVTLEFLSNKNVLYHEFEYYNDQDFYNVFNMIYEVIE